MTLADGLANGFGTALLLGVLLLAARYPLLWIACGSLPEVIAHRTALPPGFRLKEPLRLGLTYRAAHRMGLAGTALLFAPSLLPAFLMLDLGFQPSLLVTLGAFLAIGFGAIALDRLGLRLLRRAKRIPDDWRAQIA